MNLQFLDNFSSRMRHVGAYAFLFRNSMAKTTWKQYEFVDFFEQTNMIFAVLVFIMEKSLKEEPCTLDDIGVFIDTLNMQSLKKNLTYIQCKELAEFIVNVILSNEGKVMYFKALDFGAGIEKEIHISFIKNEAVYIDEQVRRTSYELTPEGYNLLLSTLEMESNMILTIQEMIFKLHIEKADYDKAVEDVKRIFDQMRIQYKKIQDAMRKIRQNALNYSIEDYRILLEENLDTITDTNKKFSGYRDHIRQRVKELEEQDINIQKLNPEESENLKNLRIIEEYLGRVLDEHQRIMNNHFELKSVYSKELEDLSQMTLIKRFNLRSELYEKVLDDASHLEKVEYFLRPLFNRNLDKIYNINKAIEIQKPIRKTNKVEEEGLLGDDEREWLLEQREREEVKYQKYYESLHLLLREIHRQGRVTLAEIKETIRDFDQLIPTTEIFKEIMIELLRNPVIDIQELQQEKKDYIGEASSLKFHLNEMILAIVEKDFGLRGLKQISSYRDPDGGTVSFENTQSETGGQRNIQCSNIIFERE